MLNDFDFSTIYRILMLVDINELERMKDYYTKHSTDIRRYGYISLIDDKIKRLKVEQKNNLKVENKIDELIGIQTDILCQCTGILNELKKINNPSHIENYYDLKEGHYYIVGEDITICGSSCSNNLVQKNVPILALCHDSLLVFDNDYYFTLNPFFSDENIKSHLVPYVIEAKRSDLDRIKNIYESLTPCEYRELFSKIDEIYPKDNNKKLEMEK